MDRNDLFLKADSLYELGNLDAAFRLFLKAAEDGDSSAMSRISCMYSNGEGIHQDYGKSLDWDSKAVKFGEDSSMLNLAITYRMVGDIKKAKHWFEKSLASGNGEAAFALAKLFMVSDKEQENVKYYLGIAVKHTNISDQSRNESHAFLAELK
jgi:TPR repeat protein